MRAATSVGVEKKNGGNSFTPPIGTVVSTCQASTARTATSNCSAIRLKRDTLSSVIAGRSASKTRVNTLVTRQSIHLLAKKMDPRLKAGGDESWANAGPNSRLRERTDDAGRALGMPVQRLDQFVTRHPGLQRCRLEIRGDQRERVVVRGARGCARTEIVRQAHQALAPDIFVGLLAGLALGKSGHGDRDAIGDPMAHPARRPPF